MDVVQELEQKVRHSTVNSLVHSITKNEGCDTSRKVR